MREDAVQMTSDGRSVPCKHRAKAARLSSSTVCRPIFACCARLALAAAALQAYLSWTQHSGTKEQLKIRPNHIITTVAWVLSA